MQEYLISYNRHGVFCLPPDSDHRKAVWRIKNRKIHERRTIRVIQSYSGDGEVIHAGAYFGDFLPGLKKCRRVWAFEPNFESYGCALKTIELNQLENVELINAALGAEKGKAKFKTMKDGVKWGGGSRIRDDGDCEVEVVTIDEILGDKRVTVIHLDVEGYEVEALKGGLLAIERWRPVLILEENDRLNSSWFQEMIVEQLGYRRNFFKVHQNAVFVV
jgi:FkbM family methyltransferase